MIETLVQVATLLLLGDEGKDAHRPDGAARRQQREVPEAGASGGPTLSGGGAPQVDRWARRWRTGWRRSSGSKRRRGGTARRHRGVEHISIRPRRSIPRRCSNSRHPGGPERDHRFTEVRLGRGCRIGASAIIAGNTELGDECQVFPFASVGLIPQDLKYKGRRNPRSHWPPERHPGIRDDQPGYARAGAG